MKIWIVKEHRGDSYRLFFQEQRPTWGEDEYWYHKWGLRGIEIPRLLRPDLMFPNLRYAKPMVVELKLIEE